MTKSLQKMSPAERERRDARSTSNEQLRDERKRLVRLGLIAGNVRADEKERSQYLNQRIREATGLEQK
jgi:hypothetical protein